MEIKITYKGIREDGVKGVWCGFKLDNITVLEEIYILYPDGDNQLKNKSTGEILSLVILKEGISQDNFEEIKIKENKDK